MTWTLRLMIAALVLTVLAFAGLVGYSYTLQAPQKPVETVVPDDKLPR